MSSIEATFGLVIMSNIAQNRIGAFAQFIYNEPNDVRDFAIENAQIQALTGQTLYTNFPASCALGNSNGQCNYAYYAALRAQVIRNGEILFAETGFPLQTETGERGYCVEDVSEFYAEGKDGSSLLSSLYANAGINPTTDFPAEPTVPGPVYFGVGVKQALDSGIFFSTVLRITLINSPPCSCVFCSIPNVNNGVNN